MKVVTFAAFFVVSFHAGLFSQTVTDFTGTDTDGKKHQLFTYLNAGKYVLVDCMTGD
jgi:hypothetical protein